jgi:hypothetical protein
MMGIQRRLLLASAATVGLMSALSTHAIAQAPPRSIGNNEGILIDAKALTVTQGTAKDDVASRIAGFGARNLGAGAIIFRSGDKLYIVDPSLPPLALNDANIDRQRSYGGLNDDRQRSYGGLNDDRQRSYGGLNDDRQRSYGGLNDDRQRSYGGLNDDRQRSYGGLNDRQQSYGGLTDAEINHLRAVLADVAADRQRSYGGMYDRQQSYGGLNDDRQRSYGGMYDRQQSYGGLNDRQQSYGGLNDPDYTNYKLKKTFDEVWGTAAKK